MNRLHISNWMKAAAIAAFLFTLPFPISPRAQTEPGIDVGNGLLRYCDGMTPKDSNSWGDGLCYGYILGSAHTYFDSKILCNSGKATHQQIRDIVVKYLIDHPESRHHNSASLILNSLSDIFSCKQ